MGLKLGKAAQKWTSEIISSYYNASIAINSVVDYDKTAMEQVDHLLFAAENLAMMAKVLLEGIKETI